MLRRRILPLVLALLFMFAPLIGAAKAGASVRIDPALAAVLTAADGTEQIEALVNFDPARTTSAALTSELQDLGLGTITFKHLDTLAVLGSALQISRIADLAGVTALYANAQIEYYLDGSVVEIGADQVWNTLGVTGKGVGIAVIDSGIDATHPDLRLGEKIVQNVKVVANAEDLKLVYGYKGRPPAKPLYVTDQPNTDTTSGHGTHVAGIAAGSGAASDGRYTGVAKDAHVVGLGVGEGATLLWVLAAFDYVLDTADEYDIRVVNNSWGETARARDWDPEHPVNEASKKLHDAGITVVFAAGNGPLNPLDANVDTMNHFAMAPWVIAVAAGCTADDEYRSAFCPDGELASFSSRGDPTMTADPIDGPIPHPTLTAPGVSIIAARAPTGAAMLSGGALLDLTFCPPDPPEYYTCNAGTSMAAPHVAGSIALMLEADPALTPDVIKSLLIETARPMQKTNHERYALWEAGAGYLDAYAAVQAAQEAR